jgi:uncharacterized small protein (DUF1192 family)
MLDEPLPPRRERGVALNELVHEDLDLYSAVDLEERIERMQDEIARTRKALDRKRAGRDAADAFFSLPAQ